MLWVVPMITPLRGFCCLETATWIDFRLFFLFMGRCKAFIFIRISLSMLLSGNKVYNFFSSLSSEPTQCCIYYYIPLSKCVNNYWFCKLKKVYPSLGSRPTRCYIYITFLCPNMSRTTNYVNKVYNTEKNSKTLFPCWG